MRTWLVKSLPRREKDLVMKQLARISQEKQAHLTKESWLGLEIEWLERNLMNSNKKPPRNLKMNKNTLKKKC